MAKLKIKYSGDYLKFKGEVKPCPFCGNEELYITDKKDFLDLYEKNDGATINIECIKCSTIMYEHKYNGRDYRKKVNALLDKWNRREENGK